MPFVGRLKSPYQPTFSQGFQQVSSILQNLAMMQIQQRFRSEEAAIANTRMEAREKAHRMWVEGRESKQQERESLSAAFKTQRESMAGQLEQRAKEREQQRKQQFKQVMVNGRPAVIDYAGRLQFVDKTTKAPASVVQEFDAWKKANPKGTWAQFYKQKKGGVGAGGPKGRTAEAQYWGTLLGVDLKTPKGRATVNKVMDKLYGRGDREKKLFMDAFRAVHSEFDDAEDSLAKAQTLYDRVMTSEKHRDFILEQEPNARYDFAAGKWYVIRNKKKEWIEVVQ